jgi:hypothetical protein
MPPGDRAVGEEIPWGTIGEVGVGCKGGRDMGIGSLGWGGVKAIGDGGGDGGGGSGFAGMTIVGSGSRAVVVVVVGAVAGKPGVARVSGRGTGFSGPAAIT